MKRLICAQFCRHCCRLTPLEVITTSSYEVAPLKALSETCTVFRDLAQPLLHHVPTINSYSCFLRTIRERPDLADSVKCLSHVHMQLTGMNGLSDHITKEGIALIKEMAAELHMISSQDKPLEDEIPHLLDVIAASGGNPDGFNEVTYYAAELQLVELEMLLHAILVASLHHLQMLIIPGWNLSEYKPRQPYKHARRRLARAGRLASDGCADVQMPSLHTIIVQEWEADSVAFQEEQEGDLLYSGVDIHVDSREFLIRHCAPSLQQLVFYEKDAPYNWPEAAAGTQETLWSLVPNLRSVVFDGMRWGHFLMAGEYDRVTAEQNDVAYERIAQMAQQCHKLRSFKIAVRNTAGATLPNPFSPSRLLQNLLPTARRLETLMIHTEWVQPAADPGMLLGARMHQFTQMQQLSLDEMCFCHHWIHGEEEDEEPRQRGEPAAACRTNSCLVDVLPTSVVSLNIRLRKKPRAVPDLVRLGRDAAAGAFRNLRSVTVEVYFYTHTESNNNIFGGGYTPIVAQPEIHAVAPKLADAFQGSGVAVEVMELQTRPIAQHVVPVL